MGASEDAAKMRVNRALEKLRKIFGKRGVTLSATLIAGAVSAGSVQAAPVGLATTVSAVAIAKGATAGGSTLALVKGALKIMTWTKTQMAVAGSAVILLAGGTATVVVEKIHEYQDEAWQLGDINSEFLLKPPYRTVILPTKSAARDKRNGTGGIAWEGDGRIYGIDAPVEELVRVAYTKKYGPVISQCRTVFEPEVSTNRFDFFSNLPVGAKEALKQKVDKKFKVTGKFESIETNVMILKIRHPDSALLKLSESNNSSIDRENGRIKLNGSSDKLAAVLEDCIKSPVLNQTGLTNNFNFTVNWDNAGRPAGAAKNLNLEALKQALIDQLGLELIPGRESIEMLVVEKAN